MFINDYLHWLYLATWWVEFRLIDCKWELEAEGWCLAREEYKYVLRKGSCVVIDPSSPTALLSYLILDVIKGPGDINTILNCNDNLLDLKFPHLSLTFHARQGESAIQSKNYSGM